MEKNKELTNEKSEYLKKQLKDYEKHTKMTPKEKQELHIWVANGNSVHSNPGLYAYASGYEMDFVDAISCELEIVKEMQM